MNTTSGKQAQSSRTAASVLLCSVMLAATWGTAGGQEPAAATSAPATRTVDNVWVDVPLSQVLRDISMQVGTAIAVDPSVADRLISLDAAGMSVEECLQKVTAGQGLAIRKLGERFYLVGSAKHDSPSITELADSRRVDLRYITARHLIASLPPSLRPYVSNGDRTTETLVFAPPETMEQILEIVRQIDVPRRQVVLEAMVVELSKETSDRLGMDWERSGRDYRLAITEAADSFTGLVRFTSINERNFRLLLVNLRMLVREGSAVIRSRPRVATLNGEKATIDVSLEEYFTILTDINSQYVRTELQVIKSGVTLEMTPHIGEDGDITVAVMTEVSDVTSRPGDVADENGVAGTLPVVRRRTASTRVRVKEGDAIVIGGLVESQERQEEKRVPILGSIPLLGRLFRSTTSSTVEKEVVIFITPRLMVEGQSALAAHHSLIDVDGELEKLRSDNGSGRPSSEAGGLPPGSVAQPSSDDPAS